MKEKNSFKKDELFLEEEEPIPEKYPSPKKIPGIILTKSYSQNNIHNQTKTKSNMKPKQKNNKITKLIGPTSINVSHISKARTTINNISLSKYEKFNIQKQLYDWQKTYLCLHPNINNSFMRRMEFDVYKRQIKEKEIDKLIEENKIKIEEKERNKIFNRLIEDANRRIEAMDNLETMKNILNNNNDITEEPIKKKYTDEQWKKIYDERFKTYLEKTKEKKENKLKIILEEKLKKEKDEINLCKVKKASNKHIQKESDKLYKEAMKLKMKKEEKLMRLRYNNRNKKNNKYIFEDEEEYDFTNKKKSNKKKNERSYNFIDDEKLNIKSYDISHCAVDKTSSGIPSIHEGRNIKKIFDNSTSETKKDNFNITNKEEINENNKIEEQKKLRLDLFEEAKKENLKKFNELNDKENLDANNCNNNNYHENKNNNNNIRNINLKKNLNKNLYIKEVSYIIDQFFLRNNVDE